VSPVVRANWLLAAVVALLAFALWRSSETPPPTYPPLTPLKPEAIRQVKIEAKGQPVEALERTAQGWRSLLTGKPVTDEAWLDHLLHIAELPSLQRFPAPEDLAPYGLDAPRYRLWFDDVLVEWGALEPLGRRRYVRTGNTVHLVTDGYTHHLHAAKGAP